MDLFMMNCELLTTCSALGYLEDEEYFKEPDCIYTVKCLIKYLHNDESTRTIRVQLGAAQILQNDILPIMTQFSSDNDLFQTTLRLVINLTQPTLLCFGGKIPKDSIMHRHFLDVLSYNQAYKEAFGAHKRIWEIFSKKIYDILETEWEDRKPEDSLLVERILVLIRNLLHTPATSEDGMKTATDMSTHDNILFQMHQAGIDSLLLYMVGSTTEQEWCLHIIEIICLLLKEQTAEQLAKAGTQRSAAERQKEGAELIEMRKKEELKRQHNRAKMAPWHSRFGGTYVMRGTKAIADDNDVIIHRPLKQCNNISFDEGKTKLKKARNRRALVDDSPARKSTWYIRNMLKEFCNSLLESGYNLMMRTIKDRLSREKAQDHDETYYFWAMNFFLEFNRLSNFRIELVSETVQLSTLHFLDTQMINYYELMINDKQEAQSWGRRMHLALRCYYEFLMTIHKMELTSNPSLKESAKVLLNNVFYVVEYREIFLTLLRKFDERKQTQSFLKDLIQTTHLFLKMFESYCKESSVVVQKKVRRKSRKLNKPQVAPSSSAMQISEEDKTMKWSEIQPALSEKVQAMDEDNSEAVHIFDPISAITEESQQGLAMLKIQNHILSSNYDQAVNILRTCRQVWPERNLFGSSDVTSADELNVLQEIFMADLSNVSEPVEQREEEDNERELSEEEDEEQEQVSHRRTEIEFNFKEYLKKFADNKIVLPYIKLLKNFQKNGSVINHCIVKMLHRVGFDLKMYGLLFQASLFRCFQKIFDEYKTDKSLKELASFAKWLISKVYETSMSNPQLFTEVLFWKNSAAEVYELTEGYGTFSSAERQRGVKWTEDEMFELKQLFDQYKSSDGDVADAILSHISNETRTRRQICNQLVRQGLVESLGDLKRARGSKPTVWRDDEIVELKTLFDEYKESADPVGDIIAMMSRKKSKKKVIDKLLSLGLVSDRKQLHKKRARKPHSTNDTEVMHIGGNTESDDGGEISEDNSCSSDEEEVDPEGTKSTLLRHCQDEGLTDEIMWIRNNLESVLQDRSSDGIDSDPLQPVPIVPFSEAQENAMENRHFRKLLKSIGIHSPSNEQEMFWRIPPSMSAEELQTAIDLFSSPPKRKRLHNSESSDSDGIASSDTRQRKRILMDEESEED